MILWLCLAGVSDMCETSRRNKPGIMTGDAVEHHRSKRRGQRGAADRVC